MNENRWKEIPDGDIVLAFSRCEYADEVHEVLKKAFGFPAYYGENWDALWDCMRDFAASQIKTRNIRICGFQKMPKEVREYCRGMLAVFSDIQEKYKKIRFMAES